MVLSIMELTIGFVALTEECACLLFQQKDTLQNHGQ